MQGAGLHHGAAGTGEPNPCNTWRVWEHAVMCNAELQRQWRMETDDNELKKRESQRIPGGKESYFPVLDNTDVSKRTCHFL